MQRDKLIESLLRPSGGGALPCGPKIHTIGEEPVQIVTPPAPSDEDPSLLEQMMALQTEARKEQETKKEVLVKASMATFGNGFKKGFFGGGGGAGGSKAAASSSSSAYPVSSAAAISSGSSSSESIPTIRPAHASGKGSKGGAGSKLLAPKSSLVLDEVQSAMQKDNPVLKELKQGEWVTPELTQIMMKNEILSRGLRNPRCTAAIQLMQSNPQEAQKRYQGDLEVDVLMREFGRVMSEHFEALGTKTAQASAAAGGGAAGGAGAVVGDIPLGPLHTEVLKRSDGAAKIQETSTAEEERVKQIIADPELKELLMDFDMQRILQECNDPQKFQRHMRDPVVAYKIKRLWDAGLVGTTK